MGRSGYSSFFAACVVGAALLFPAPTSAQSWAVNGILLASAGLSPNATSAVTDGSGGVYVTWANWGTPDFEIFLQHYDVNGDRASGWPEAGMSVTGLAGVQYIPELVPDGSGGVYVAWTDFRTNGVESHVYLTRVNSNGSYASGWSQGGRVIDTEAACWAYGPKMVSDGAGGVVVAYVAYYANFSYSGVKAIRYDAAGTVSANWSSSGHWVSSYYFSDEPQIIADGLGSYVVTFQADNATNVITYAKRINRNGVLDPNWSWGPFYKGVEVGSTSGGDKVACAMALAAPGKVACAFIDEYRGGGDSDIRACMFDSTGAYEGTGNWWMTVDVATVVGDCEAPQIVPDGSGGVMMAWRDLRAVTGGGQPKLYATRYDASGTRTGSGYTANPMVTDSVGSGVQLLRMSDGNYRAAFGSTTGDGDIRAVQFSQGFVVSSGWSSFTGNAVCTVAGAQFSRGMVASTGTDAIVVWDDQRSGTAGIYAAKIQTTGAVPALSSLRLIEAGAGRVTVEWTIEGEHAVSVERSVDGVAWDAVGDAVEFASGQFRFVDEQAVAGTQVAYRPVFASGGHGEAAWVQVPGAAVTALRFAQGNPARGAVLIECTLASGAPARLRVHDVGGRLVESRTLEGGGVRSVSWSRGERPAGLYFVTLEQAGVTHRRKLTLLD